MKRKQSGSKIMMRLIKLVKPLAFFMVLAVILGVTGFLCAIQITVLGSMTLLTAAGINGGLAIKTGCICIIIFAVLRGFLHYGEQACNHYIAFKLLAIIRDKVFKSLRRLTPAKLEGKDKGNLISLITSDIELLEVFMLTRFLRFVLRFNKPCYADIYWQIQYLAYACCTCGLHYSRHYYSTCII